MVVRYGEGGIRTPDKAFRPYNGLANRRLQPLGHLSPERQRRQSPGLVQPPDPALRLIAPDLLGGRFSTMILVVGATGLLGGEICRRLRERGQPVRALARHTSDPSKVQRLRVFMEVWLSPALGFDFTKGAAQIFGTAKQPISWISLSDVAEFAVTCVGHAAARNALIGLGGPEALSPEDVVRTFEEVTGRHFDTQHVAETALQEQWRVAADPLQADDLGATNIVMQATVSTAAYGCCTILLPFRNFIAHQNATALVADPTTISPVVNPVRAFRSTTWIMLTLMPLVVTPLPVGVCSLSTT